MNGKYLAGAMDTIRLPMCLAPTAPDLIAQQQGGYVFTRLARSYSTRINVAPLLVPELELSFSIRPLPGPAIV
jgi:hypothetical protein